MATVWLAGVLLGAAGGNVPLEIENPSFERWASRPAPDPLWDLAELSFPVGWEPESYKGKPSTARPARNPAWDAGTYGRTALYLRGQIVSSPICKPLDNLLNRTLLVSVRARGSGGHLTVGLRAYHYPPTEHFLYLAEVLEADTTDQWQTYSAVVLVHCGSGLRSIRLVLEADGVFVDDVRATVLERPQADDPVRLTVPVVGPAGAPRIDGVFAAGEWESAGEVTGFANIATGSLSLRQGRVGLVTDGQRLFLGVRWPADRPLKAHVEKRDGDVWTDDAFEVFLGPWPKPGTRPDIYQLVVNAKGVVFDQRLRPDIGQQEPGWNSSAEIRSAVAEGVWTLEMAIPLAEAGIQPGEAFGLQLCRDFASPPEYTSLTGGPYQQLFRCQPSGTAPRISWTCTGDLATGAIDLYLTVGNPSDQPWAGHARIAVTGAVQRQAAKALRLAPGASQMLILPLADQPRPYGEFVIEVGPDAGEPGFRQRFVLNTGHFAAKTPSRLANPRIEFYPVQKKLCVRAQHVPASDRPLYHEARLRITSGDRLVQEARLSPAVWAEQEAHFVLPFDPPDQAVYAVEALIVDAQGHVVEQVRTTVQRQAMPWLGNRLGLDPVVIPPLTAIRSADRTVSCWGRDHTLGPLGLPETISVLGRPLLAGAVRLTAVDSRGQAHTGAGDLRVTSRADHEVAFQSPGTLAELDLRVAGSVWYDGLLAYRLELRPKGPTPLRRLSLEVPLAGATYLHAVRDSMRENSEWLRVPEGPGVVWSSATVPSRRVVGTFVPFVWVGDERAGLAWFADNDRGWINDAASPCLELVREGRTAVLRVNFVAREGTLAGPVTLRFGLQATPVRPTPVAPSHKFKINYFGFDNPIVGAYSQGMISKDPWLARQILQPRLQRGESAHVYMANEEMPVADPVSRHLYYEWAHSSFQLYRDGLSLLKYRFYGPDPEHYIAFQNCAVPSRVDYNLFCFDQLLDLGLSGLYMDNSYPYACTNLQHPECGFLRPDGRLQAGYNLWNTREVIRRVAVRAFQKQGLWPRVSVHMTGAMVIPCFSFADLCIDGEDRSQMSMDKDFMDWWPLDRVAIFGAVAWGPMRGWLPKIHFEEGIRQERPTRTMLAELKLFDLWIWPAHCHTGLLQRLLDIEKAAGLAENDVQFLGYWENQAQVKIDAREVRSSFYVRPGRVALLYVSNFNRQDVEAKVELDLSAFGLAGAKVIDAETGQPVPREAGAYRVRLPWHDFRLLKAVKEG